MSKKEDIKKKIEELKKQIDEEKKRHSEKIKNIEKEKNDELAKTKIDNEAKITKLVEDTSKMFKDLNEQLKEIQETGEKKTNELKNKAKDDFKEEKEKILKDKKLKKTTTKSNIKKDNIESEINKEKEEIQKLMNENQKLLFEARQNQNEINFYEMNFGSLFFSEELKKEIGEETAKFQSEYDNFYKQKMQEFNQYKMDPQLNRFLQLVQYNPYMYNYLIPQIYYEFSGQA